MENLKIIFIGDIFSEAGIKKVEQELPSLIEKEKVDFVIAQAENVSGRKGFNKRDYLRLKKAGVNAFTLGNHVWANEDIFQIIKNEDVIRPLNIENHYKGHGSSIFNIKNKKLKVVSLLGITFNQLLKPWKEDYANNFFDAIDKEIEKQDYDFMFVDFHAETTSEKNVLGLYLNNKGVDALVGTHTHVQTNDARILDNNLVYISDVGMTGPSDSAIGANYQEVYEKMRFDKRIRFQVSNNVSQFNAVLINLNKKGSKIRVLNFI